MVAQVIGDLKPTIVQDAVVVRHGSRFRSWIVRACKSSTRAGHSFGRDQSRRSNEHNVVQEVWLLPVILVP